jgi:hypothetical protein
LPEVKEEIERILLEEKRENAVETYLDQLRAKADIRQNGKGSR